MNKVLRYNGAYSFMPNAFFYIHQPRAGGISSLHDYFTCKEEVYVVVGEKYVFHLLIFFSMVLLEPKDLGCSVAWKNWVSNFIPYFVPSSEGILYFPALQRSGCITPEFYIPENRSILADWNKAMLLT